MLRLLIIYFALQISMGVSITELSAQENLIQTAQKYLEEQNYKKAIELFEKIVADSPSDIESSKKLGRLYGIVEEYDRAILLFSRLLKQFPNDYDILLLTAQVYSWKNDYTQAETYYKRIISESPDYLDAYIGLARIYYWQEIYSPALNVLNKALDKNPSNPEILSLIVRIYYDSGNYKKAHYYNDRLTNLYPDSEEGLYFKNLLKLYSIELGGGYDRISTMDDWKEGRISFLYKPHKKFTGIIQASSFNRFEKNDHQVVLNIYATLSDRLNIQGLFGVGLENNFLPKQRMNLELSYLFGKTVGLVGGHYLNFPAGSIKIYILGLEYYFPGNIFSEYKYYNSRGENNNSNETHLIRLHFLNEKRYHFSLGYVTGGEVFRAESEEEIFEIKSTSLLTNFVYFFNALIGIRTSFSYTDRKDSYHRFTYNTGLIISF